MTSTAAPYEPRLARMAGLIADASRARMLAHLLDGAFAPAGELARAASVGAATASGHLRQLLDAGLVACEARGRHRYYRLADADVAHALEALAMVAERGSHDRAWAHPARAALREARCCYGHLAGRFGVALFDGLRAQGWLAARDGGHYAVTADGATGLSALGLDGAAWQRLTQGAGRGSARVAYGCLDWSERRDHLAGRLAAALATHFVAQDWLRRRPGSRALAWTPGGRQALGGLVRLPDERP